MDLSSPAAAVTPDYAAIKVRQQATWASGDYAVIGTTLQIVGETLCEAVDLQAGQSVLDVAAGNGNATLAAARRFADVTSTDYVPALLERGRARAEAEGLAARFEPADAEQLPYAADSFDAVLSTFGVMFCPHPEQAAAELARVCRPGGRIGLANWTPDSFIGDMFRIVGRYVPPPAGLKSPLQWGANDRLRELFAGHAVSAAQRHFNFRYRSPQHWLDTFRTWYGPTHRAFAALDDAGRHALAEELLALARRHNRGGEAMIVPSAYLEAVIDVR
jgi:SAM-dependent methyltransferase